MPLMNEFVKIHGPQVDSDWQRVNAFYQLSLQLKTFVFPEPLAIKGQQIVYRQLENFDSWKQIVTTPAAAEKFTSAGMALGSLHQQNLPVRADFVDLHSDFGLVNIGWSGQKNLPIFFDPLPGKFFPYSGFEGDRHYDLGQFISTFFAPHYYRYLCKISPDLPEILINAFLCGYRQNCGKILTRDKLLKFARFTHRRYMILRLQEMVWPLKILVAPLAWWLQKKMEKVIECLIIA